MDLCIKSDFDVSFDLKICQDNLASRKLKEAKHTRISAVAANFSKPISQYSQERGSQLLLYFHLKFSYKIKQYSKG